MTAKRTARKVVQVKPESKEMSAALTAEEQAIARRVMADSGSRGEWTQIKEVINYEIGKDVFALPAPAKKKQDEKNYVYRWIERTPRRLDEVRNKEVPFKWWICNATNTPYLKEFLDPVLGCVSREDQMLMFQPYWMKIKRDEILRRQNEGYRDLNARDGEQKAEGMSFVAGKQIKPGDNVVFDEEAGDLEGIIDPNELGGK